MLSTTNVMFTNLARDVTKNDLVDLAGLFGQIKSAKVIFNLQTGQSKCFGFVEFAETDVATRAITQLDGMLVKGRKIHAKFAASSEKYGKPSRTVFAKSLPLYYTDKQIYDLFSKAGKVIAVKIVRKVVNKKNVRGYHIMFNSISDAYNAINMFDNVVIVENGWPLFIRFTDDECLISGKTNNASLPPVEKKEDHKNNLNFFDEPAQDWSEFI